MAKILQIVGDGNPGGGTTVVLSLLEDLNKTYGADILFITQKNSYALEAAEKIGVKAVGLDFAAGRFNPALGISLRRLALEFQPDIIHYHGARAAFSSIRKLRDLLPKAGTVYTVHGYHFHKKPLPLRLLGALAERFIHTFASATVFVCEADKAEGERWHLLPRGSRHTVIYNGIAVDDVPSPHQRAPNVIGFVGRLCVQKNPEMMLLIADQARGKGFHFRIIGGGELEPLLRERISALSLEDSVTISGKLSRSDALAALDQCSLLVLPSLWEGLPVVCQEAQLMGIPVLAANVNGVKEIVQDGITGITLDNYNVPEWVATIERLSKDHVLRDSMAHAGRQFVLSRFQRYQMTAEYHKIYASLMSGDDHGEGDLSRRTSEFPHNPRAILSERSIA